jgi:hypothetical protein
LFLTSETEKKTKLEGILVSKSLATDARVMSPHLAAQNNPVHSAEKESTPKELTIACAAYISGAQ